MKTKPCEDPQTEGVKEGKGQQSEGNPYREKPADELCNAGERRSVAFILRQTTAQKPQPALPHLDSHGASRGEQLGALFSHSQRLHGCRLRAGVSQRVKHKHHAQPRKEQNDPAVEKDIEIGLYGEVTWGTGGGSDCERETGGVWTTGVAGFPNRGGSFPCGIAVDYSVDYLCGIYRRFRHHTAGSVGRTPKYTFQWVNMNVFYQHK
ncbi:hypothetical protein INR49_000917 [Caranx melampygus]|nr:hypothetical protein INR49_000917 [Caranx melampygus]